MAALQRRLLVIGQPFLVAVGLIRRCQHDLLDDRATPAGLQKRPGAANIGLEGGRRVAIRDGHNGLSRQVNDRVDFVFAQHALQQRLVAHVPAYAGHFLQQAGTHQLALRRPIAYQADNLGPGRHHTTHKPTAHQPGGARNKRGAIPPKLTVERLAHAHTLHGGLPLCHRLRSRRTSRK